ncbi:hypothetical protein PIB30_101021, partial [Stylosanthes scabra]|nr:hypothetical protein [Stylosanthes scabra]
SKDRSVVSWNQTEDGRNPNSQRRNRGDQQPPTDTWKRNRPEEPDYPAVGSSLKGTLRETYPIDCDRCGGGEVSGRAG